MNLILKADLTNIEEFKLIFQEFGEYFGLQCNWDTPKIVIWHWLQIYIFKEWKFLQAKIDSNILDFRVVRKIFTKDFGTGSLVYKFHKDKLVVALVLSRPP